MLERFTKKIEQARQKPEHIRMRYALLLVFISMIFVVGIWFLSVKQGFSSFSPAAKERQKEAAAVLGGVEKPQSQSGRSLQSLLESEKTLRIQKNTATGKEFIENQQ
jgi:hypothetical protein